MKHNFGNGEVGNSVSHSATPPQYFPAFINCQSRDSVTNLQILVSLLRVTSEQVEHASHCQKRHSPFSCYFDLQKSGLVYQAAAINLPHLHTST